MARLRKGSTTSVGRLSRCQGCGAAGAPPASGPERGSRPGSMGRSRPSTRPRLPLSDQERVRCGAMSVAVASVGTTPVSRVIRRIRALRSSRKAAIVW